MSTQNSLPQNPKANNLELDWKSPELWADPDLARRIPKKWGRFNLYNDLCRGVVRHGMSGTLDELQRIATGDLILPGFGPVKRIKLSEFLDVGEEQDNDE